MSDTSDAFEDTGTDDRTTREEDPSRMPDGPVRDEVRLDLDEGSLDTWDEVRGDYALDPDSTVARPALTESEQDDEDDVTTGGEDSEEDDLAEDDDDKDVHEEE